MRGRSTRTATTIASSASASSCATSTASTPTAIPSTVSRRRSRAATAAETAAHFRHHFGGRNLIFAFSGDVDPDALAASLARTFHGLSDGARAAAERARAARAGALKGWRIELVDKPDRQQTQLMFGHPTVRASDADYVPLQIAMAAFGGRAMSSTLMDEVRRKRGLAYGAYLILEERRGAGAAVGWVFSGTDKTVAMLKLVLNLYVTFMEKGLSPADVAFFQRFLIGSHAADMDVPEQRLDARVSAEIAGLPADFVDSYAVARRGRLARRGQRGDQASRPRARSGASPWSPPPR